jgi:REP element-mobilizing transposase RayT
VGASPRKPNITNHQPRSGDITNSVKTMAGTYTKLFYHIVFSTKNRRRFITSNIEDELHKYISGIVRGIGGVCVEINGMPDHMHLLAILPPKVAVSDALREIKANSSKWVHESKPSLAKFAWQDGYAAFTVSKSQVDPVREYIRAQKSHHAERDYKAEFLELLVRHDTEYDEQYLWD